MPNLFVIAGPNGAGKTTYAQRFLREEMGAHEFVNADLIAPGLSPFLPGRATFDAGRIMLKRMRELAGRGENFAFETTLSGRTYLTLLKEMRAIGYRVRLDFLWISDLEVARDRVRQRVAKGGHDVPDAVQQRRFHLGIRNLATLYRPLLDSWRLFDNTADELLLVAHEEKGAFQLRHAATLALIEQRARVAFMPPRPPMIVQEGSAYKLDAETHAAVRAMRKAYADTVLENLRFGLPVIQGTIDGKVARVSAEQLAPRARRILEANGEFLPGERKPGGW